MKRHEKTSQGHSKKRRMEFGAPSADDNRKVTTVEPSSSVYSKRQAPGGALPSLATLCARVFASNSDKLLEGEALGQFTRDCLKLLPEMLVPKVFSVVQATLASTRQSALQPASIKAVSRLITRPMSHLLISTTLLALSPGGLRVLLWQWFAYRGHI